MPLGEPLLSRVRVRAGYEDLARALFGSVNLVDDLREVLRIYGGRRLPATFATLTNSSSAAEAVRSSVMRTSYIG